MTVLPRIISCLLLDLAGSKSAILHVEILLYHFSRCLHDF